MPIPAGIRRAFRLPTTAARLGRDLDDEVRFHVEMRVAALVARGMPADEARAEALRRFGDPDELRDYCLSMEVPQMQRTNLRERLHSLAQDFRFAVRQARRAPGFTTIATLTLALGIGATTAIFSVVSAVVLKPLPFPEPSRIVQLWEVGARGEHIHFADPNFDDIRAQSRTLDGVAELNANPTTVVVHGEASLTIASQVSHDFFRVLGVRAVAGRLFTDDEQREGAAPAAVISYGFWQQRFGGAPSAIGSTISVDGSLATIVGVLPPELEHPADTEIWLPRELERHLPSRTAHNWSVVARVRPGVSVDDAQRDVSAIARRLKLEYGDQTNAVDAAVVPLQDQIVGPVRRTLYLLFGASALLLAIACTNVVNLLVARMAARENELALRVAIGAGRGRILQQLLVEASLLAALGGVGGVLLALGGARVLVALRPANLPRAVDVAVDWRVLLFAFGAAAATAVALGAIAAWRGGSSRDLRASLASAARTQAGGASGRVRGALVVAQLALSVVLLVGAGLLARSFVKLMRVDPGFRTRDVVIAELSLPAAGDSAKRTERVQYLDEALDRLRAIPGVRAAGGSSVVPLGDGGGNGTFGVLDRADEPITMPMLEQMFQDRSRTGYAEFRVVSPDYFATMRIPVIQGRAFEARDRAGAPHVGVISASLARKRWPGENPIGKVIEFGNMDGDLTPITIVGVVGDVREESLAKEPSPTVYVDYRQRPMQAWSFALVASVDPGAPVAEALRRSLAGLRSDIPARLTTIETQVSRSVAERRFMLLLVGVFAGVALLLATIGVYGVIAYLVAQRERELGIRVALGARRGDILLLVLRQGATLAVIGALLGAVGALAVTRVMAGMLYEISPSDPLSYLGVVAVLCAVAVAATIPPARRASRAEPMSVLRS